MERNFTKLSEFQMLAFIKDIRQPRAIGNSHRAQNDNIVLYDVHGSVHVLSIEHTYIYIVHYVPNPK
jgi:hypothetical protein